MNPRVRRLARSFFDRMFENEILSSPVSASHATTWLMAALATPGVMVSVSQYYFYAHARTFAPEQQDRILLVSQAFHVDFAMAVAGLVTMLMWTSLTPDRRDAFVLGSLPLTLAEQARARLLALLRFFALFAVAASLPSAIAFTFVTAGDVTVFDLLRRITGHLAATLAGAGFVFFLLVDVQLLLAALAGPRGVALGSWPLQAAALAGTVAAFSQTPDLARSVSAAGALADPSVMWNPAAWFVGLYRLAAGDQREIVGSLAQRGIIGAAAVVMVGVLAYPLAYGRCLRHAVAAEGQRAAWWSGILARCWLRAMRPALRTPLERGLAAFMIANLTRSHAHRFLIGGYVGLGMLFTLPLSPRLLGPTESATVQYAWFAIPLGLLCWSVAGVRVAMMLPIEPAANWIFKLTEPVDKARVLAAAVKTAHAAVAMPLAALFAIAALMAGDAGLALLIFSIVCATGGVLIEAVMLTLRTVPGTCTYRPGQLRLRVLWPVYLIAWTLVGYVLPRVAVSSARDPRAATTLVATLVLMWIVLSRWRATRAQKLQHLVYDATEAPATTTLDISISRT
jgi:hypothetical protein